VFVSSDPVCIERERRVRQAREAYEAACAACPACPRAAAAEEFLLELLRLTPLRPWQTGLRDFPEVVSALSEAAATPRRRVTP
jgi:hypothetical protein